MREEERKFIYLLRLQIHARRLYTNNCGGTYAVGRVYIQASNGCNCSLPFNLHCYSYSLKWYPKNKKTLDNLD